MDPLLGQILLVPYPFVPVGWAACDGSTLPINSNEALYSLLGNKFGGEPTKTFALPNFAALTPSGCTYIIATTGTYPPRP